MMKIYELNPHIKPKVESRASAGIKKDSFKDILNSTIGSDTLKDYTVKRVPTLIGHYDLYIKKGEEISHIGNINPSYYGLKLYMEDQLLSAPGGDDYYFEADRVEMEDTDQKTFGKRIWKDLADAYLNFKNLFKDLIQGAEFYWKGRDGNIHRSRRRGLLASIKDFFKDLGDGISFGIFSFKKIKGIWDRIVYPFRRLKRALFYDLFQGVSNSIVHITKDLVLGIWNLLEVVPDSTIGSLGREASKAIGRAFDMGQVFIQYVMDVIPFGDGWIRVHSSDIKRGKLPIFHNLSLPEHFSIDKRWRYIRNTRFRKAIETVGSLLSDLGAFMFIGRLKLPSNESKKDH